MSAVDDTDIDLLASDLDGTLLGAGGLISERTRRALAAAPAAGLHVALVSGRPLRWMLPVLADTAHDGVAVCANGAVLLDLASGTVQAVHPLERDAALEAVRVLRALVPGIGFALERTRAGYRWDPSEAAALDTPQERERVQRAGAGRGDFALEPDFPWRAGPRPQGHASAAVEELLAHADAAPVVKLLARAEPAEGRHVDDMLAEAEQALRGIAEVTHSNSADLLLELSGAGVSKASTLAEAALGMGLTAEQVAAVGDMPNDLPMLGWAGRAFAVGNAHPAVLRFADEVLPAHDEDGVAVLLERLVAARGPDTHGDKANARRT